MTELRRVAHRMARPAVQRAIRSATVSVSATIALACLVAACDVAPPIAESIPADSIPAGSIIPDPAPALSPEVLPLALPTPSTPPALTRSLTRILTRAFPPTAPGAAVLVTQAGRVLYAAGHGLADRKTRAPIDVDTAFHAGSVGKQFTALAILMLVDDGKLVLDEPVGTYLPELRKLGRGVTLRRLLGHTAGIPDVYEALYEAAADADAADAAAPGAPRNGDLVAAVADAVDTPDDLAFEPGTAYEYSNAGYDIVGAVIERVTGQAYADFLAARVFEPLGMASTFAWDPARLATAHRARGYAPTSVGGWKVVDHDPLDALNGSGSIYTTVADLYRYEQGLRAGTLLSAASAAEWTSPATLADGGSTGYGLGWQVWHDDGALVWSHDGLWLGYSAYVARSPTHDLMVAVLSNNADADPEAVGLEMAEEVLESRSSNRRGFCGATAQPLPARWGAPVLPSCRWRGLTPCCQRS